MTEIGQSSEIERLRDQLSETRRQLARARDRQAVSLAEDLARVLNRIKRAQLDASYQDGLELTRDDANESAYFSLTWRVDGKSRNLDVEWDVRTATWTVNGNLPR